MTPGRRPKACAQFGTKPKRPRACSYISRTGPSACSGGIVRMNVTTAVLRLDPDVELAVLFLELVRGDRCLRVAQRGAGAQVELPHVLEAGEHLAVVDAVGERHVGVRARRLAREEFGPGVGDHDAGAALDGDLLQAL